MKITTMTEALSLVPEYWPLVPGVDKWREGDQFFSSGIRWAAVSVPHWIGQDVGENCRRPIPQSVRDAEARWVLYQALADGAPQEYGYCFLLLPDIEDDGSLSIAIGEVQYGGSSRTFSLKEKAKKAYDRLGGEQAVIQILTEGPGALWRWVAEMRGNQ